LKTATKIYLLMNLITAGYAIIDLDIIKLQTNVKHAFSEIQQIIKCKFNALVQIYWNLMIRMKKLFLIIRLFLNQALKNLILNILEIIHKKKLK